MSALMTRDRYPAADRRQQLSYPRLFWLFIAGSLMGFVMEGMFHLLRQGTWAFRVGTLWGPFCVIYGAGAVAMYLVALLVQRNKPLTQFAVFALTGSAVEFLAGLFQLIFFGTQSWNYSSHALNLGGFISLKMTLLWGAAGMGLMYIILPLLLRSFNQLNLDRRLVLCRVMSAFMCVNLLMTSIALMRWHERVSQGTPASNTVEAYLDDHWPDERMRERFPNMEFTGGADALDSSFPSLLREGFCCGREKCTKKTQEVQFPPRMRLVSRALMW